MKLSKIEMFLNEVIEVTEFKNIIKSEVIEYKKLLKKKGASVPISVIEDIDFNFSKSNFLFLCELYLNDKLEDYELSYVADALTLSSHIKFQNEELFDSLESLCISGENKISKELVTQKKLQT